MILRQCSRIQGLTYIREFLSLEEKGKVLAAV
jgi:hypothetical protein